MSLFGAASSNEGLLFFYDEACLKYFSPDQCPFGCFTQHFAACLLSELIFSILTC